MLSQRPPSRRGSGDAPRCGRMPSTKERKKRRENVQAVRGGAVLTTDKAAHWPNEYRARKDGKGPWGVLIIEGGPAKSNKELANAVLIGLRLQDDKK